MRVYIDTEFTDLRFRELISLGMVDEDGRTFYGEHAGYDTSICSDFVKENVIPYLGKQESNAYATLSRLKDEVVNWLGQYNHVTLAFDHPVDWEQFINLMGFHIQANVSPLNIRHEIDQNKLTEFFATTGLVAHHALNDAVANKYAVK